MESQVSASGQEGLGHNVQGVPSALLIPRMPEDWHVGSMDLYERPLREAVFQSPVAMDEEQGDKGGFITLN